VETFRVCKNILGVTLVIAYGAIPIVGWYRPGIVPYLALAFPVVVLEYARLVRRLAGRSTA
jgi:hypothetical protein